MAHENLLIIANPKSGRGKGRELAEAVREALEAMGAAASVFVTGSKGEARKRARACALERSGETARKIVVIGGDGTVNEVVNGLTGSDVSFTVFAAGTGNIVAREFKMPRDVEGVAEIALTGRRMRIDAGVFRGRAFLCVASAGFDAEVARVYRKERTSSTGYFEYVHPFTKSLLDYRLPAASVAIDGAPLCSPVTWIMAANTRLYGGKAVFCEDADPTDGFLDVVALPLRSTFVAVPYFLLALARRFSLAPGVRVSKARIIRILAADSPMPVQLDGDFAGFCEPGEHCEISVLPGALSIIAPAAETARMEAGNLEAP